MRFFVPHIFYTSTGPTSAALEHISCTRNLVRSLLFARWSMTEMLLCLCAGCISNIASCDSFCTKQILLLVSSGLGGTHPVCKAFCKALRIFSVCSLGTVFLCQSSATAASQNIGEVADIHKQSIPCRLCIPYICDRCLHDSNSSM